MKGEEHLSPDGRLTLVVTQDAGDIAVGFAGFAWHTHGDLLAGSYPYCEIEGITPEDAARRFVQDILTHRAVIAVLSSGGAVRDVWVTDDIAKEMRCLQSGEEIEFRHWDGTKVRPPER